MADYTSTNNNLLGTDFIGGVITGLEEFVAIPVSADKTIVLQGNFDGDPNTNVLSFEGERWVLDRGDGFNYTYTAEYTPNVNCTVEITNSYYCRGNLDNMSTIESRKLSAITNFYTITIALGVILCAVLSPFLRLCLRSRSRS